MPFTTYTTSKKITSIKGSYGSPRWFDAVYSGDTEYIRKHAKNIGKRDELGYSALHHAAIAGLRDVSELLVEVGEDVDAKGQDGATPLRCAVQEGHARVVEILLGRGASFLDKDEDGLSMLHCAASEGHQAVVNIILTHAPWLANEQSWSGWSPLHSAAVMGHSQVVTTLLAFGANPRLKNNQGKTAGELAKERNKLEVCHRIQEFTQQTGQLETVSSVAARAEDAGRGGGEAGEAVVRSAEVTSILECPVCLDTMVQVRIYQCRNGHNVCERCSSNPALASCPQCREPYRNLKVRNLGLEQLASLQQASTQRRGSREEEREQE